MSVGPYGIIRRMSAPENSNSGSTLADIGIVLSGGGSRAAYQAGALRALAKHIESDPHPVSVVVGTSIGAVNGLVLSACLKEGIQCASDEIAALWRERTFRNTFLGSPSKAFIRSIKIAVLRYSSPGPVATSHAIFDPTPLINRIDLVLGQRGGLKLDSRDSRLKAVAVMATVEGHQRKPLLIVSAHRTIAEHMLEGASFDTCYVDELTAKHGLASAALPSVLPPVEMNVVEGKMRLVDGGICDNFPIDPAIRLGAQRILLLDSSGREWWHNFYNEPTYTPPSWEVPAREQAFCMRPADYLVVKNKEPLGMLLKQAVSGSRKEFISSLGPTWPIFSLLKRRLGELVAYEIMSYVALHSEYVEALMERGYQDTLEVLKTTQFFSNVQQATHSTERIARRG